MKMVGAYKCFVINKVIKPLFCDPKLEPSSRNPWYVLTESGPQCRAGSTWLS